MWQTQWNVIHEESIGFLIGASFALVAAGVATWRRRRRELREINQGHQFQQLEFAYAFVTTDRNGQRRFVVRMIGCLPLKVFVAKDAIRSHLLGLTRESADDELNSVISMEGKVGSFVLRELHGHLRTLLQEKGLKREWWLMVPILETYRPLQYVAPTVLLVRKSDLPIFASFDACKDLLVHHGSDAAKILTLMEVYRKFKDQEHRLAQARAEGQSTQYLEEMWLLDLCLSTEMLEPTTEEVAAGTLKPFRIPPWNRFASTLKQLGLTVTASIEEQSHDESRQLVVSGA